MSVEELARNFADGKADLRVLYFALHDELQRREAKQAQELSDAITDIVRDAQPEVKLTALVAVCADALRGDAGLTDVFVAELERHVSTPQEER